MTIHSLPDPKYDAAFETAFSEHQKWDWIQELTHEQAIDLLSRMWSAYTSNEPGPLIWRHQSAVDVLTNAADNYCQVYAQEHASEYLDEGEEF